MKQNRTKSTDEEEFTIDAIAMKRRLQEEFYEATKDLSPEELIAYIRQRIANSEFADFLSQPSPSSKAVPTNEKA
jgi:hypothetical protein